MTHSHSWGLELWGALARTRFSFNGSAPFRAFPTPIISPWEEPIVISLIPLHYALFILLLFWESLHYRCHPTLLSFPDKWIYVSNVISVSKVSHSVHFIFFIFFLAFFFLNLKDFDLDIHNRLGCILIHGTFRNFIACPTTTLRLWFNHFDRILSR